MKAILCKTFGLPESLSLSEVPDPKIQGGDVLIKVKACGVNFPDVLIIQDKYQFKPALPFSPGGEISGEVISVGEKVKHLKAGDRVIALSGWGGFAEQAAVNANRVFPIPPGMDFITGAVTLYTYGTSIHALKDRAALQKGEKLLVLGAAGGVGLAAVELGKVMGAQVIAAASSDDKLAVCREKGAEFTINYSKEDLKERVKEITQGKGVDVIYDPVGGPLAEAALRSMAWKGRYLVVGFANGEIQKFPANLPLLKGCSIMGVFWGNFAEIEAQQNLQNFGLLLNWIQAGKISQHIHKIYTLEDAPQALKDLMDRKVKGKAVIKIGQWTDNLPKPLPAAEVKTSEPQVASKPLVIKFVEIKNYIGRDLPVSEWFVVTQEMINDFAKATHDYQWVHVDIEKAKHLMPEGKTIAHGYLTMSLASKFFFELLTIEGPSSAINYGLNKARFPAPVKSGGRIRMTGKIMNVEDIPQGGIKLYLECKIEAEGEEKPAYVGELITALY